MPMTACMTSTSHSPPVRLYSSVHRSPPWRTACTQASRHSMVGCAHGAGAGGVAAGCVPHTPTMFLHMSTGEARRNTNVAGSRSPACGRGMLLAASRAATCPHGDVRGALRATQRDGHRRDVAVVRYLHRGIVPAANIHKRAGTSGLHSVRAGGTAGQACSLLSGLQRPSGSLAHPSAVTAAM